MINTNSQNTLKEILEKIQKDEILLPNFQRNFVWNDIEKQKKLLASYLCALPIGTLLLLCGEKNEFSTRRVGSKCTESSNSNENVRYLLDGQQRITTLSNIFSNIIFENIENNWNNFISTGLKRRYFLELKEENDLFGLCTFTFPWNVKEEYPTYSVNDIYDLIHLENIMKDDVDKIYHPKHNKTEQNEIIKWYADKNLIPLFYIYEEETFKLLKKIVKRIAQNYYLNKFDNFENILELQAKYSTTELTILNISLDKNIESIKDGLNDKQEQWADDMISFLDKLRYTDMAIIDVPKEQRGRAIEIYENINLGGVTLNEFDLLTARAAKITSKDVEVYNLLKYNPQDSLPEYIKKLLNDTIQLPSTNGLNKNNSWNCYKNFNVYDENKNLINKSIIQQYLKLLNIFNKFNTSSVSVYSKIDKSLISQKASLELDAPEIYKYTEKVMKGINRACAFLQIHGGLINISELNYDLMLIPLAYILCDDELLISEQIINKLNYWYWGSIFSGRYNTDQSEKCAYDLKNLTLWIKKSIENPYKDSFEKDLFKLNNFSDDDTILLKKASLEITPKQVIINSILRFILIHKKSRDLDIFAKQKDVILINKSTKLHIHHIIPLAEVKKIGESTNQIRKDKSNLMNCVGNLTLITEAANLNLSSLSPAEYFTYLQEKFSDNGTILESHCITDAIKDIDLKNVNQREKYITDRYKSIKQYIITTIDNFILEY